jgi:hypothetical protein
LNLNSSKNPKPALVVLAAGLARRYGSLKQIDQFGPSGETIIDYSIYDALRAGFEKVVFVIRRSIEEEFREVFMGKFSEHLEIDYALQEVDRLPAGARASAQRQKPWGTAHALWVAGEKVGGSFAVINADDFYGRRSFALLYDAMLGLDPAVPSGVIVGFELQNTLSPYGQVARGVCRVDGEGFLIDIQEKTRISERDGVIVNEEEDGSLLVLAPDTPVSMNLAGFTHGMLEHLDQGLRDYLQHYGQDLEKEYYLPTAVEQLITARQRSVRVIRTPERWFGVTYKDDKPIARERIARLVSEGAYPNKLWNG